MGKVTNPLIVGALSVGIVAETIHGKGEPHVERGEIRLPDQVLRATSTAVSTGSISHDGTLTVGGTAGQVADDA